MVVLLRVFVKLLLSKSQSLEFSSPSVVCPVLYNPLSNASRVKPLFLCRSSSQCLGVAAWLVSFPRPKVIGSTWLFHSATKVAKRKSTRRRASSWPNQVPPRHIPVYSTQLGGSHPAHLTHPPFQASKNLLKASPITIPHHGLLADGALGRHATHASRADPLDKASGILDGHAAPALRNAPDTRLHLAAPEQASTVTRPQPQLLVRRSHCVVLPFQLKLSGLFQFGLI